jgi:hypothetical protein
MNAQSTFALETENKIRFLHFQVNAKLGKRLGPDFQAVPLMIESLLTKYFWPSYS